MTPCFWVVDETDLTEMLARVAGGEEPSAVLAEFYANYDHEYYQIGTQEE